MDIPVFSLDSRLPAKTALRIRAHLTMFAIVPLVACVSLPAFMPDVDPMLQYAAFYLGVSDIGIGYYLGKKSLAAPGPAYGFYADKLVISGPGLKTVEISYNDILTVEKAEPHAKDTARELVVLRFTLAHAVESGPNRRETNVLLAAFSDMGQPFDRILKIMKRPNAA